MQVCVRVKEMMTVLVNQTSEQARAVCCNMHSRHRTQLYILIKK